MLMKTKPKSKQRGRPKTVVGELVTCSFELTVAQHQAVGRLAKQMKISRSQFMRGLLDAAALPVGS